MRLVALAHIESVPFKVIQPVDSIQCHDKSLPYIIQFVLRSLHLLHIKHPLGVIQHRYF